MSKIKFEKAKRLIAGEFINQLSWWPEWFPPVNLAVLQSPLKDNDTRAWQAAIESAVKTGELVNTPKPYLWRPLVFDLSKDFAEQGVPCDQQTITAPDFAAWLTVQGEKPSELIAAWFAAAGVQAGTVDCMTTAPPKPVETVKERCARLLKWHNEECRIKPRGALQRVYEREAKQNPKADRSKIGKDINKARETAKTEKVTGQWIKQLVKDGKREG